MAKKSRGSAKDAKKVKKDTKESSKKEKKEKTEKKDKGKEKKKKKSSSTIQSEVDQKKAEDEDRRPRERGRGPPAESGDDEMGDLLQGKFSQKAVEASSAAKSLLGFLAPEIRQCNMSVKDQGFMVDAMVQDGLDPELI
eukprot:s494_g13.t1